VADIDPLKNIYRRTLENLHAQALAADGVPA
jgi:succinyl-diaminopimelate desuccinylase